MKFTPETARKVAGKCGDGEVAYVIYSLASEVERNHTTIVELEEGLLDLQLRLSVLLAQLPEKDPEDTTTTTTTTTTTPENVNEESTGPVITGARIQISDGVYLEDVVDSLQQENTNTKYLRRIGYGQI